MTREATGAGDACMCSRERTLRRDVWMRSWAERMVAEGMWTVTQRVRMVTGRAEKVPGGS